MEKDDSKHKQISKTYALKQELGRGAFSIVRLGVHKKTKNKVAIKIIDKKNVGKDYEKNLRMEMEILKTVDHDNIIRLLEMVESPNFLYFVMELVTGGELFDRIVEKGSYTEEDARILVRKIVSAVLYLHNLDIAHRDLKPENLLVKSSETDTDVKIADFGLSKIIDSDKLMETACGTPGYVAPEVLNAEGYDREVDMWSIGVITYILLCGFPPFYSDSVPEVFEQILNADFDYPEEYWDDISDEAKEFINKLLVVDPQKRLTAEEALATSWLKLKGRATANAMVQRKKKSKKDRKKLSKFQTKMKTYVAVRKQQSLAQAIADE